MASLLSASPPASHWPGLQAVLCKADHGRWREGHCQNPQQRQTVQKGDMGWESHCPHAHTRHSTECHHAAAPPASGSPIHLLPGTLHTHPISAVGHAGLWGWWHSQGFQGLLSSMSSAHSILTVTGPGHSKTGPVEVAECHRSCWEGCKLRVASLPPCENSAPFQQASSSLALPDFVLSLSLS